MRAKEPTPWIELLAEANRAADHTVFVSDWLRDYHASRWFDLMRPHSVILNGADPSIFHPIGAATWKPGTPLRLVTHHWSDNMSKGFELYARIDEVIASGQPSGCGDLDRRPMARANPLEERKDIRPACWRRPGGTAAPVSCLRYRFEARTRRDASGGRSAMRAAAPL